LRQQEATEQEEQQQAQKMVPHEALHAEKQKTKRYTEEVSSLRQEIAERDAAWERRIAALMEAQKPKQEPKQAPDWFENPDAATQHAVAPKFDAVNRMLMENAKLVAGLKYGDDKIEAADRAFMEAVQTGRIDQADYQRVTTAPNIYAAAVQWHQRQQAQAEIGDDPAAYRARLEAEIREKLTAELQQGEQAQQRQAVMPSNIAGARNVGSRTGPAWSGPPSLQDIFAR
jgi:hypothetical protein